MRTRPENPVSLSVQSTILVRLASFLPRLPVLLALPALTAIILSEAAAFAGLHPACPAQPRLPVLLALPAMPGIQPQGLPALPGPGPQGRRPHRHHPQRGRRLRLPSPCVPCLARLPVLLALPSLMQAAPNTFPLPISSTTLPPPSRPSPPCCIPWARLALPALRSLPAHATCPACPACHAGAPPSRPPPPPPSSAARPPPSLAFTLRALPAQAACPANPAFPDASSTCFASFANLLHPQGSRLHVASRGRAWPCLPCVPFLPKLPVLLALPALPGLRPQGHRPPRHHLQRGRRLRLPTPCVPCLCRLPAQPGLHQRGRRHRLPPPCLLRLPSLLALPALSGLQQQGPPPSQACTLWLHRWSPSAIAAPRHVPKFCFTRGKSHSCLSGRPMLQAMVAMHHQTT